ncbi:hypothetical protein O6H91_09G049500 [Diphasiastrum complanatum]|nr:hypothetical protein O6H91_09G049500 [Diphasiastrum complanatum]
MEGISCDRSHWRTDICFVRGDVRMKTKSIQLHSQDRHRSHVVEKVKPYPRKWETAVMENVDEVTIESLYAPSVSAASTDGIMNCNVNYSTPAVIFSTGGYSGNVYHDFNDGLIPLYITTHHLQGEVVFLILEYHEWWLKKYGQVLQQLSHYPVVDLSNDYSTVHCFREAIVGLKIHDELSINPKLLADHVGSIKDFRQMLQQAFIPSDDRQLSNYASADNGRRVPQFGSSKKPKLVLIARKGSRAILNQAKLIALAKQLGFQVKVIIPTDTTKLERIFRLLNSCDVMMGVHGAAMTHLLFMRPGTVFIQIIPLGTDYPALTYYGEPAKKLGLDYIEYKITAQESSLSQKYNEHDRVLSDPQIIASQGWPSLKKYYLQGQSVRLFMPRIKLVLQKALQKIKLERNKVKISNQ